MPTSEERLTTLEKTVALLQKSSSSNIQELHRNLTMVLGIVSSQELDIKEIKISLITVEERMDSMSQRMESGFETLERSVNSRFETQQRIIESLEQSMNGRFEGLEQSMNGRFEVQDKRFEAQDKKLDQILLLLNRLTPKTDQEI